MHEKKKTILASEEQTLLDIIKSSCKELSNKTIKNYIKHKMVEVNNKKETNCNKIINKNSVITIYFTLRRVPKIDLEIIYEDKDLIAINKPSGLLSISNKKEKEITAFRLVSDYIKRNNPKAKLFVVHRLDEQTSGILLFSKNLKLKELLQKNWNNLVLLREYYCVIAGHMEAKGIIKSYLTMNHNQIVYSTKNKELGHLAITKYERIKQNKAYSLLRVEIDTGKRNQIRVHMSEKNHPIVGDKKYGSVVNPIGRLALHASRLIIKDPRTNAIIELYSEVPKEILTLVP